MYACRTSSWLAHALFGVIFVWPVSAQSVNPPIPAAPPDKFQAPSQDSARKGVTYEEFVDAAILQERRLTKLMRNFKLVVETYVQEEKHESGGQSSPKDDHYFLSRLDL